MAQDEIVKILKVETGDSQQTVKGLREEIKDLRDSILNLEEGTEDYSKAVNKLQKDQRKLDQVMSLTKKTATALDGSYDALVQKMSLLKKEWRATNDQAKRNELGKEIAKINNQLKDMDAEIGNYQRNVGNYTESIIDAFEQMNHSIDEWKNKAADAWEKGDIEAYTEAIEEAGRAQAKVEKIEMDLETSTPSLEKNFQSLTDTASGLAGGFEAIQSIMILAGRDTEDFEKVMIKVQATMALVQGIQGIGGLIKGLKGLKTAVKAVNATVKATMASNPVGWIMLIVGAVASLTAALAKNGSATKKAKEETAELADEQARLRGELERSNEAYNKEASLLAARGYNKIEIQERLKGMAEERVKEAEEARRKVGKELQGHLNWANKADQAMGYKPRAKLLEADPDSLMPIINEYSPSNMAPSGKIKKTRELYDIYRQADENVKKAEEQLEERSKNLIDTKDLVKAELEKADEDFEVSLLGQIAVMKKRHEEELKLYQDSGMDTAVLLKRQRKEMQDFLDEGINSIIDSAADIDLGEDEDIINEKIDLGPGSNDAVKNAGYTIKAKEREYRKKQNDLILMDESEAQKAEYDMLRAFQDEKLALLKKAEGEETDVVEKAKVAQEIADLEIDIERTKNEEIKRLRDEDLEDEKAKAEKSKEIAEQKKQVATESLNAIAGILGGLASVYQQDLDNQLAAGKISEEAYNEKFKKLKAIQIAEATINTISGALGAFMGITKDTGGWGIALAAIQAASIAATGAFQIAQISKTTPGASNVQRGMVQPPANIFNDQEPAPVKNITGYKETEELNKATKVYILESDLQESSKRVQVREDETSF